MASKNSEENEVNYGDEPSFAPRKPGFLSDSMYEIAVLERCP